MKTILLACALASYGMIHAETVIPQLPPAAFPDTEASTNVPFSFARAHAGRFAFTLDFNATASNNVQVAFGEDADANGLLDCDETCLALAWDCGQWRLRGDVAAPVFTADPATNVEAKSLAWSLRLARGRTPRRLAVEENGRVLFGGLAADPPPWVFDPEWNMVRVTVRGVDVADERLAISVLADSLILRLR